MVAIIYHRGLQGYTFPEKFGHPMFGYWTWGLGFVCMLFLQRADRWLWVGMVLLCGLIALGPAWPTEAMAIPMPHYLLLTEVLPFWNRLWFPYRMIGFALLAVSIGMGLFLQRMAGRLAWVIALPLAGIAAAEQQEFLSVPLMHRELVVPSIYSDIRKAGGGIIELPIGFAKTLNYLAGGASAACFWWYGRECFNFS